MADLKMSIDVRDIPEVRAELERLRVEVRQWMRVALVFAVALVAVSSVLGWCVFGWCTQ